MKNKLKGLYEFSDPITTDYCYGAVRSLVEGDKKQIDESDVILINHWKQTTGTAMEHLYAWERKKEVIFIINGKAKDINPWSMYHSTAVFETLDKAISYLEKIHENTK